MLAVVAIGGKQYNVTVGTKFRTEKIDVEEGKTFDINNVLLLSDEEGKDTKIGMPILKGETVQAKVLSHGKGDKIRVFKMKAKKRYQKVQGHRQQYTELEIVSIGGKKAKPAAKKTATVKKDVTNAKKTDKVKPAETKAAPKKTASTKEKKETAKK